MLTYATWIWVQCISDQQYTDRLCVCVCKYLHVRINQNMDVF